MLSLQLYHCSNCSLQHFLDHPFFKSPLNHILFSLKSGSDFTIYRHSVFLEYFALIKFSSKDLSRILDKLKPKMPGHAFAEKHPQLIYDQCPYLNRSAPCSHDFINTQIDQLEQLHFAWKRAFVIGQFSKLVMITVNRVDCIGDFTDRSR